VLIKATAVNDLVRNFMTTSLIREVFT